MQNLENCSLQRLGQIAVFLTAVTTGTCMKTKCNNYNSWGFRTCSILAGCRTWRSGSAGAFSSSWAYTNWTLSAASLRCMKTGSGLRLSHCSRSNRSLSSSSLRRLSWRSNSLMRASRIVSVKASRCPAADLLFPVQTTECDSTNVHSVAYHTSTHCSKCGHNAYVCAVACHDQCSLCCRPLPAQSLLHHCQHHHLLPEVHLTPFVESLKVIITFTVQRNETYSAGHNCVSCYFVIHTWSAQKSTSNSEHIWWAFSLKATTPNLDVFLGGNSWPLPEQVWTKLVDNFPWFQAVHFFYLHAIDALQPASSLIFSCWPPSQLWLLLSKSAASRLRHIAFRLCHQVINIFHCTDQCYQTWNVRQPSLPFRPKPDSQKVNSVCHYSCTYFVNSLTFSFLSCFSRTSRWSCRLHTLISLVEGRVTQIAAFALAATSGHFSGKR